MAEFQRLQGLQPVMTTPMTPEEIAARTYRGLLNAPDAIPQSVAPGSVNIPLGNTRIDININRAQVDGGELVDQINRALVQRGLSVKVLK